VEPQFPPNPLERLATLGHDIEDRPGSRDPILCLTQRRVLPFQGEPHVAGERVDGRLRRDDQQIEVPLPVPGARLDLARYPELEQEHLDPQQ